MKIADLYQKKDPVFSFEFFPPKTEDGALALWQTLQETKKLNPGFISITYGAGGSTRGQTFDLARRAKQELALEVMVHLTCLGHSAQELQEILARLHLDGIENIIALRGDTPKDATQFVAHPQGFKHAIDLVQLAKQTGQFCVAAAGYPEGHVETTDKKKDWNYLLQKIRAGAQVIITQLFLDNKDYFELDQFLKDSGANAVLVPGIMPIGNYSQVLRFSQMCGAKIPAQLQQDLHALQNDPQALALYGLDYATRQCKELLSRGARGIHFYTLNKSDSTRKILQEL